VYDDYCTENILVMEYIPGKNILEAKKDKKKIIDIVTKSVYKMLFEDRFFHADLHPGNIFFYNNKITFLDFGIVGHLNKDLEKKLFLLFQGMVTPDLDKIAEAIVELNIGEDEPDLNILKEGIYNNFAEYYNRPIKQMEFGKVFYSTIEVAKRARIKVPAELVLFGKSIATMQGFCKELNPDFNVVQSARPYVEALVKKQYSAGSIFKSAKEIAIQYHEMMLSVPMLVRDAGRKFGKIEERIIDIDNTFRDLSQIMLRIAKMVTMAILFTAFFIASLILIDRLPLYKGISLFSVVFFIFSLIALLEVIREYSYSKK
jgi:ubiquinone biosynthesis protein